MDSWGQLSVEVTTNTFSTFDARDDRRVNGTVFYENDFSFCVSFAVDP